MARFIRNRTKLKGKAPGSYIFLGEQKMEEPRVRIIRYSEDKYEDYVVKTAMVLRNPPPADQQGRHQVIGFHSFAGPDTGTSFRKAPNL